jgi:ABC-type multidrug transport system fused ATPase/permease subunit
MEIIKKLYSFLNPEERKKAKLLLVMIFIMGILDTLGVVSILPFITILSNPQLLETNIFLKNIYITAGKFGIESSNQFMLMLGFFFFIIFVITLLFKAFVIYLNLHFSYMKQHTIGERLTHSYLSREYSWFLKRNSADLGKNILSDVNTVVDQAIIPLMQLISQGTISIILIFFLFFIDPIVALIALIVLGGSYGLILKASSSFLEGIGKSRLKNNHDRFVTIREVFDAIKEIKLSGLEEFYLHRFNVCSIMNAKLQAKAQAISQIPRFALEVVAFGGLILIVITIAHRNDNILTALPMIALYAFAGYRLIPCLQQVYFSIVHIRYMAPTINNLHKDFNKLPKIIKNQQKSKMMLKKSIILKNIYYHYPNLNKPFLEGLNLTIPAFNVIGLSGATGSGKTTILNLIIGLLEPQKGTLEIDGEIINEANLRNWQRSIGYVPQQIYLAEDTVCANIAFGQDQKNIDHEAVERVAKIVNMHEFITKELPQQYHTILNRDSNLSGGQRQLIGIARALYQNPQVLILDEATNALDKTTERVVVDSLLKLKNTTTSILVSHSNSVLVKCDKIFMLDKGFFKEQSILNSL